MRIVIALAALALAGCVSQSEVESHPVTSAGGADAHRRAEVHTALAGEYFARGNFAVALSETRLAIKDDPAYVPAYNMQGLVFMELRDDVPAREAFDQALNLQPGNSEVLNNFGWFLCTRGDAARGKAMIQRAIDDPLYATKEKAYLSMGLCLRSTRHNAEAEKMLRRAVQIRPDLLGALYNLAILTYERGAYHDAENYITRYTRLANPTLDGLGLAVRIARANKDETSADSYYQQLRRRFPDAQLTRELAPKR